MEKSAIIGDKLRSIDGRDYGAYQSLKGVYDFPGFTLLIERIPKDPYAPPHTGIYRVRVPYEYSGLCVEIRKTPLREIALRDFLARRIFRAGRDNARENRGTGYSGTITVDKPGQTVLERSSVVCTDLYIEVRLFLGLPADGRRINGKIAEEMLLTELPRIVESALGQKNIDPAALVLHIDTVEDAEYIRGELKDSGLASFIADGSLLPRISGNSDKPMAAPAAVPFVSPESLRIVLHPPHCGEIRGMGIPRGITLITGGGYHGKSTLLNVIEQGIYRHIPGDGREKCVTDPTAVKIRAYSGRAVTDVDISPFIKNLPAMKDTTSFSTENASGSTSQAAGIQEAAEAGAGLLLMDEDTCAANFMIRDHKMQQLVRKEDEPITAYIDKAGQLYKENGISTILVLGGIGDYFDIADKVIQMVRYKPFDVTEKAIKISESSPSKRAAEDSGERISVNQRIPLPGCIDPFNKYGKKSIYAREIHRINFGKTVIDLTDAEQLVELSQTKALMHALCYLERYIDGKRTINEIISLFMKELSEKGLDMLSDYVSGHFAGFRGFELVFAFNRLRGIRISKKD